MVETGLRPVSTRFIQFNVNTITTPGIDVLLVVPNCHIVNFA